MGYFGSDQDPVFDGRVFPEQGHSRDEVMELLAKFEEQDVTDVYAHNTIQSTTLMGHLEAAELAKDANRMFLRRNMLYSSLMPGTARIAAEVKQMVKEMLGFPTEARVRLTSGGPRACTVRSTPRGSGRGWSDASPIRRLSCHIRSTRHSRSGVTIPESGLSGSSSARTCERMW